MSLTTTTTGTTAEDLLTQNGTTARAVSSIPSDLSKTSTSSSILHASLKSNPSQIISAKGNYITTSTGQKIFDATGGAAVACLGHSHPRVRKAILKQLDSVAYVYSPFFSTPASEALAAKLVASTEGEMTKAFIVSSGTEAVEAALKLARQYFLELPVPQAERVNFIARKQSYHGNTLGALGVGSHVARRKMYAPLLSGNTAHISPAHVYRGLQDNREEEGAYVARLLKEVEDEFLRLGPDTVCGVVVETMAGLTLGAVPPPKGYIAGLKAWCVEHGALLILDEVMCGMGRTGSLHAWQQEEGDAVPHLQTVAKGLGAGYQPIGALLVNRSVVEVLERGTGSFVHSQTYQGHPVACAAALEVQNVIEEERLVENVKTLGTYLGSELERRLGAHPNVGDIRGRGFLWGIEFVQNKQIKDPFPASRKLAAQLHAVGMSPGFDISLLPGGGVADGTNGDVIVVAPAYNCSREDVEFIVEKMVKVIEEVLEPI
ncbi:aminotransferase like protein [Zymoseptoria brevis]|uniref:Aminotransferase like protein n=1 Tax=Zymoseptoria brevis TaxID=1047168 RepID=A0A0F4GSL5_9PEZI|nr:aminotransferase like protein [Zymoseptoria brevis]